MGQACVYTIIDTYTHTHTCACILNSSTIYTHISGQCWPSPGYKMAKKLSVIKDRLKEWGKEILGNQRGNMTNYSLSRRD